jgi:O-antigen biosynthesis protein
LARSLRQLGQDVDVQTHDRADSLTARSRDIHMVLRGLAPVRRTSGQRHILWVISHPESLDIAECDAADLVLVASSRFADHLRARTSTPVEVFLQATDPDRFSSRPPAPEHQHPVTVVAKTRTVMRRVVADALAAGIRPAIYGSGWRGLVDPSLVVADHVDNDALPIVYSSAGVVLNDHWDTMRAWGFVSNRIFDVLACGAPVISDDVSEVHDLFGEAVPTYRSSAELGELVRHALEDPDGARARAAGGRAIVLAHHTFDHRARQLLELLEHHGLVGAAAP